MRTWEPAAGPGGGLVIERVGSSRSLRGGRVAQPKFALVNLLIFKKHYIASKTVENFAVWGALLLFGQRVHVAGVQLEFRATQSLGPGLRAVSPSLRVST